MSLNFFNRFEKVVLIAEDEEANYQFLKTLLNRQGISCIKTNNGEEALQFFTNDLKKIGLILMDIKMPKMDGITATKKIRDLSSGIPVIMQSAYDLNNELTEA